MSVPISVSEALEAASEKYRQNLLVFLLLALLPIPLEQAFNSFDSRDLWIELLCLAAFFMLKWAIDMILCAAALLALENTKISVKELLGALNIALFWRVFLANLIFIVGFVMGAILLIVPGVIFYMATIFYQFVIIDEELAPAAAFKRSFELTKGNRGKLLLLILAIFWPMLPLALMDAISGTESTMFALYPLLVAPLTMLSIGYFYRSILASR